MAGLIEHLSESGNSYPMVEERVSVTGASALSDWLPCIETGLLLLLNLGIGYAGIEKSIPLSDAEQYTEFKAVDTTESIIQYAEDQGRSTPEQERKVR